MSVQGWSQGWSQAGEAGEDHDAGPVSEMESGEARKLRRLMNEAGARGEETEVVEAFCDGLGFSRELREWEERVLMQKTEERE